ncbi:MAG TPA: hypothetical protein DCR12_05285 [Lachnospiraceae bacterium]|nr:hypothetical protein [Lachnospiraceae bacterium]
MKQTLYLRVWWLTIMLNMVILLAAVVDYALLLGFGG